MALTSRVDWNPGRGETIVSYSQNAEDVRLWRVFGAVENGFYVDIGAADPSIGSVTRLFYDRGWSGINVEPSPLFGELVKARPRDVNLRTAVAESEGEAAFFLTYPDLGMSTLDPKHHAEVEDTVDRVDEIKVSKARLETILREHASGRTIHFLKIDVEGAENEVLASSDWDTFRPIVVVVEAVEPWTTTPTHERWEHVLTEADYVFAAFDGINRFYVDRAHETLVPALAYPISALDRFELAAVHEREAEAQRARELEAQLRPTIRELRDEKRETADLRHTLARTTELLVEANEERARLGGELERLRRFERDLTTVFQSRTYRAGKIAARLGEPVLRVARSGTVRRARAARALRPAQAYAAATRKGKPWHFARRRTQIGLPTARTPLDSLVGRLGKSEDDLGLRRATELVEEIDRLGWTDDESLLSGRLTWTERQAVIEADAVARLVSGLRTNPQQRGPSLSGKPAVVVDARCLQDPAYRARGVGLHAGAVLRATRAAAPDHALVILTSAELPDVDDEVAEIADRIAVTAAVIPDFQVSLFVELSPMTASAAPAVPLLLEPECRTASVVYDFIPTTYPSAYLRSTTDVVTNRVRIEALRHYDLLLPISTATEVECRRVLRRDVQTSVTGVADPLSGVTPAPVYTRRPFFLVPGGGDPRKNIAAAITALAEHRRTGDQSLRAVVTGVLTPAQADALHQLARQLGLPHDAVELRGSVSDRELTSLYQAAELAFVASFAEGFSIPITEALLRGTPVVASDIPAHRELVGVGPWLGAPADVPGLASALSYVRGEQDAALERQLDALGDTADPRSVFDRTTAAIEGLLGDRLETPAAPRPARSRPRLAVVSPFPPQPSGVADYTALTLREVAKYADVEVYSGARPNGRSSFPVHPITTEPYLDRQFDSVVNVVGNSHFHFPALDLMESYGGACIAHDNRMIEAYRYYSGDARTAELLSTPTQLVQPETIGELLLDLDTLPSIGYQVIARQASPLIVHGQALADRIQHETGVAAKVVPFVPYNVPAGALTRKDLERSRAELGLASDVLHVATFGFVDRRTKGADIIVGAAAWLRSWAVPLELHVVGEVSPEERRLLEQLRDDLELGDQVVFHGRVSAELLNDFLLAVDVAVQLRTSTVLSLSGALADCIAFGVPTVTTQDVADEMDAPSYVQAVNSPTSSLLVAETIDGLRHLRRTEFERIEDERRDYLSRRSVDAYARSLLEALGLDWT